MYTLRQSAVMCWGKLRRFFLVSLRKKSVAEMLERRRGECLRCGACCKLLFRCPSFDDSNGGPRCLDYHDRPGPCGLFPLDEKDLRDRNIVQPHRTCGYRFERHPNGNGNGNGNGKHGSCPLETPIRWGPPKTHPDGKRKFLRGPLAILWAHIKRSNGNGHS